MEPKGLLCLIFCLIILITDIKVQSMSTVNADFERYLRAMNSSTTVPNMDERMVIDSYILAVLNFSYVNNEDELVRFSEENARYGEGKVLNVQGLLVHVTSSMDRDDDKACKSDILGTNGNPFPTHRSWIALVRRGECTFEEKVKNVAFKGAVGIIVYNDKPVMNLEKMQIKDKNRNITAVMTLQEVGQRLGTIADQGFEVHAFITRGRSGVRPINTLNKTSVLFVSISFIVLMIISLVWLIFYYIHRLRYLQSKDQQSRHLCSVTKRAIMRIPTKTVKSNDKDGECDCCAICIEVYKSSDCIRVLPCKHEFHKNCIDPWLIEHRTCPMCKLDVLKYYGYVVGESSTALSPTSDRVISTNDHVIIVPPNAISSNFESNSNNSSSNSTSITNTSSSFSNNRGIPASIDETHNINNRLNNSSGVHISSGTAVNNGTASRQVTDV